ncbi:MAG: antibiotic biosynthesis monooxygenase [Actinomycetota bacterium]|nr:antibiotic biosynthesis monooxygenase [Actinomycetota bacterium]
MLRRATEADWKFVLFSLWDSIDQVKGFAGEDVDQAVFYPEDDRFLIDRDLTVSHYEVVEATGAQHGVAI